jgi:hypothetical protein
MRKFSIAAGALEASQRSRLDEARVLIVGTGGIGGVIAHEFARLGLGALTLVDFDAYDESNLNRQIACYPDTIGKPKAEILARELGRLGTCGKIEAIVEKRSADGFTREIADSDFVVAAADDYAFSLALMDRALALGKPAGAALPIGLWAAGCVFLPGGPPPSRLLGLRVRDDERSYAEEIERNRSALARRILRRSGGAETESLRAFAEGRGRPPQLCPVVWSAGSLLVLEAVKCLARAGKPIAAPRYFEISSRGLRVRRSMQALARVAPAR